MILIQFFQYLIRSIFFFHISSQMAQVAGLTKSVTILLPKILDVLSSILVIMLVVFLGRKKIMLTTLVLVFFFFLI